jgi:hypothetical protein
LRKGAGASRLARCHRGRAKKTAARHCPCTRTACSASASISKRSGFSDLPDWLHAHRRSRFPLTARRCASSASSAPLPMPSPRFSRSNPAETTSVPNIIAVAMLPLGFAISRGDLDEAPMLCAGLLVCLCAGELRRRMERPAPIELDNASRDPHLFLCEALAPFMVRQKRNRPTIWPATATIVKSMEGVHSYPHRVGKMETAGKHDCVWRGKPAARRRALAVRQVPQAAGYLHHDWRGVYDDNSTLEVIHKILERADIRLHQ